MFSRMESEVHSVSKNKLSFTKKMVRGIPWTIHSHGLPFTATLLTLLHINCHNLIFNNIAPLFIMFCIEWSWKPSLHSETFDYFSAYRPRLCITKIHIYLTLRFMSSLWTPSSLCHYFVNIDFFTITYIGIGLQLNRRD
jgi:hypothetical protein